MRHRIPHQLSDSVARKVARHAVDSYVQRFDRYQPRVDWRSEDSAHIGFSAKGVSLAGKLQLEPGEIVLELDVPFLFRPLQGKAKDLIERQVAKWIAKAERGELDP